MKYTLTFLLLALLLGACKDKNTNTGTLEVKFIATYDDTPLVLGQNLAYDDYQLQILKSEFFVSEIALTDGSEIIEVQDIDFVDFTNTNFTLENAENGFTLSFSEIPEGNYDGIRFGIGVPPTQNTTVPADYNSDHVLSTGGFYWDAWNSFIFTKLEGKYEDEVGDFSGFFFHTGLDEMFRTSEGAINIDISEDNTTVVEVYIDHKKLLEEQSGQYFDIQNNFANHDPLEPGPLLMLVNNYSQAISYK